ncbi:hypothetical protein BRD00_04550 [Halobacteriales archaeon QS_8_69_26]|nr:MAG: hypothetical protein BRD00_04550 [Halobacteriales archaeon QS_8_69_26]
MTLEDLAETVEDAYGEMDDSPEVDLDRETKHELALLLAALDTDDTDELLRRGVHLLFQTAVESGKVDFHLRTEYDVTYDEYLMDTTMDTYNEQQGFPQPDQNDDRRYQF